MKKIIFASALTISTMFAMDISSVAGTAASSLGITAESVGNQLTEIVKSKSPETAEQAKSYCTQASTYKSFVGIKDDGLMAQAIDICAQKSSTGLTAVKEEVTSKAVSAAPSVLDTATNLLGK